MADAAVKSSEMSRLPGDQHAGRGISALFLTDPLSEVRDIKMIAQAVRKRWAIPDDVKQTVVERLHAIVERESVTTMTKNGMEHVEAVADQNSVAAARVLAMLEGQNQKDEHKLADAESAKAGDTYNIGCVGQIAMGQEPLTPEDAKRQVQEVLARVKARIGVTSPPAESSTVIDVTPSQSRISALDDL